MKTKIDNSVIRVGIDLGTTNSEIATSFDNEVQIIKNSLGDQYTPSVFGITKGGDKIVGKKAYDKLFKNPSKEELANNYAEIKRLMGTNSVITFSRSKKKFTPEDISAEILKSLKADALRKYSDLPTIAAVITVPASFSSLQNEATKRAGQLAGFEHVVLLQEPIAAALAYGFSRTKDANWLVYDLGGGTFDVALISSKDGILKVIKHEGDNFLGGKDIDNILLNSIIKPKILTEFNIKDFDNNTPKFKSAFAKLKAIAEATKIELSQYDKTTIEIDNIGNDDDGKEIYLSFTYTRADFEKLINPIVAKTIAISKKVIESSGIAQKAISKVVLVGGPTQIPYIREQIQSKLGIPVDATVDPLTTVATGACIYGLSERIPQDIISSAREHSDPTEVHLTLNYEAMTSEEDELVTGQIDLPDDTEYYIKISSDSGFYNSQDIKVKNGKFFDTVAIEQNKTNTFWIYLIDNMGNKIPIYPESFTITHGLTVQGAPITHDIGIIYAKKDFESNFELAETCDRFFEQGSNLPLKETRTYKTARSLQKDTENLLPIKVYEGEAANPANNDVITRIDISGKNLPYNLPEGTDLDLTIEINESREVFVEVYIPSIDLTVNARADMYAQDVSVDSLKHNLQVQKQRLTKTSPNISEAEKASIDNDIDAIERSIEDAADVDSKQKAERDLREFSQKIDDLESSKAISQLANDFAKSTKEAQAAINALDDSSSLNLKQTLSNELKYAQNDGENAIKNNDKELLVRVNEQIETIHYQAAMDGPAFWVECLNQFKNSLKYLLPDQQTADYHINKADEAIASGNLEELKRNIRALAAMLPQDSQITTNVDLAGITK